MKRSGETKKLKIYFLGSGKIGIPSLKKLKSSSFIELCGIGTQPDRPFGRNRKNFFPTDVAVWAEKNSLPVQKLSTVNSEEFVKIIIEKKVDMILVASFGQILKESVLSSPALGCINIHASLLPKYRGASPIQAAILNGDEKTGITFMQMDKGLDTGGIYSQFECSIDQHLTSPELENILADLAGEHIENVLLDIASGKLQPIPQDDSLASYAPKIKKNDGLINPETDTAIYINNKLRAYTPWPGIFCFINVKNKKIRIKILSLELLEYFDTTSKPGSFITDKKSLIMVCKKGYLKILRLQPEGKRVMTGEEFLRGYHDLVIYKDEKS